MLPDLAPWLTLSGSKYPCLEQFSVVPKIFEPLKFDCSLQYQVILQWVDKEGPSPEVIDFFSCSTQLSMKFSLLINIKLAFSYLLAEKILRSAMFSKKEFAIVSNLRFISRTNFMLSWVEHENSSIISSPVLTVEWLGLLWSFAVCHTTWDSFSHVWSCMICTGRKGPFKCLLVTKASCSKCC